MDIPENRDSKLNEKLAQSDEAALATMEPIAEVKPEEDKLPRRAEEIIKEKEEVPEVKEPAKEEQKAGETDEEFDARVEAIQPKKGAHPDTAKGYAALRAVIKEERARAQKEEKSRKELEGKLASLETEYKEKMITPEMETEIAELKEMRRQYQIEKDPEFQAKYSSKLAEIDQRAISILSASGMQPDLQKFITDNGGVIAMYNSTKSMPEGNPYSGQTHQQFIENVILPKLPAIQQTRLQQAIGAGMDLRDEMGREIEFVKTHGSELQQKRQKELEALFKQSAEATRKSFGKMAEKWDILESDSPEEKAKKEKHNKRVEKAEAAFTEYMKDGSKNPAKVAEALVRASQSQYLMEEAAEKDETIAARDKKIAELEERLEKVKGSASTGKPNNAPAPDSKPIPGKLLSDDEALSKF